MEPSLEPGAMSCAYCYKVGLKETFACGRCKKRILCSKECAAADWKSGHKTWCTRAGEAGVDFEVKLVAVDNPPTKGLGTFAKRRFRKGDYVMVERPLAMYLRQTSVGTLEADSVVQNVLRQIPRSAQAAVEALCPYNNEDLGAKLQYNGLDCRDNRGGLFIRMSRVNHSCVANCFRRFWEHQNLMVLIACRDVAEGDEIVVSYCDPTRPVRERTEWLREHYGFQCTCDGCVDEKVGQRLESVPKVDAEVLKALDSHQFDQVLAWSNKLMELLDEFGLLDMYSRTYYVMFQATVLRRLPSQQSIAYVRKAHDYDLLCNGQTDPDYDKYLKRPGDHLPS
jgi:hypothetical protein